MLCLSGVELYSRLVPLIHRTRAWIAIKISANVWVLEIFSKKFGENRLSIAKVRYKNCNFDREIVHVIMLTTMTSCYRSWFPKQAYLYAFSV